MDVTTLRIRPNDAIEFFTSDLSYQLGIADALAEGWRAYERYVKDEFDGEAPGMFPCIPEGSLKTLPRSLQAKLNNEIIKLEDAADKLDFALEPYRSSKPVTITEESAMTSCAGKYAKAIRETIKAANGGKVDQRKARYPKDQEAITILSAMLKMKQRDKGSNRNRTNAQIALDYAGNGQHRARMLYGKLTGGNGNEQREHGTKPIKADAAAKQWGKHLSDYELHHEKRE